MTNRALPASNRYEKEEQMEGDRPAQTTCPPWWGPEHGGNMQEHTGITCLSTSRSPRPPRARSVPAGPSSQHQGSMQPCTQPSGIVRNAMSPVSVSATLFADIRDRRAHMDTDPSGRKSSPGCRMGQGGSAAPARRSRAALRGRRVRGMVGHHRWCMARMAEQLFLMSWYPLG